MVSKKFRISTGTKICTNWNGIIFDVTEKSWKQTFKQEKWKDNLIQKWTCIQIFLFKTYLIFPSREDLVLLSFVLA